MLDAAVTFRDGIGVDDLTWLAGLISAIAVIVGAVWAMLRPVRAQLHRWEDFWDDWTGTPAGPGRSAVPVRPAVRHLRRNPMARATSAGAKRRS